MRAPGTRRATLAVVVCELVPIPLLDTVLQNEVRRAWLGWLVDRHGLPLAAHEVCDLADRELAPIRRAALWPVKAIAEKLFPPLALWGAFSVARDTWQLGLRIGETAYPSFGARPSC